MEIRYAQKQDIEGWLTLVRLSADNFPGLETDGFRSAVELAIEEKSAFVAIDLNKVAGAVAFSREGKEILFLAVRPDFRKQGVGSALIARTCREFPAGTSITVTTFRDNDISGRPAVAFYKSLGFRFCGLCYEYGYPCQRLFVTLK